jgi:hypothetical protein
MIEYKENYGADADGNRGRMITEYELELSDEPEIIQQLTEQLEGIDRDEWPLTLPVYLLDRNDDDVEFEVDPRDYL